MAPAAGGGDGDADGNGNGHGNGRGSGNGAAGCGEAADMAGHKINNFRAFTKKKRKGRIIYIKKRDVGSIQRVAHGDIITLSHRWQGKGWEINSFLKLILCEFWHTVQLGK